MVLVRRTKYLNNINSWSQQYKETVTVTFWFSRISIQRQQCQLKVSGYYYIILCKFCTEMSLPWISFGIGLSDLTWSLQVHIQWFYNNCLCKQYKYVSLNTEADKRKGAAQFQYDNQVRVLTLLLESEVRYRRIHSHTDCRRQKKVDKDIW